MQLVYYVDDHLIPLAMDTPGSVLNYVEQLYPGLSKQKQLAWQNRCIAVTTKSYTGFYGFSLEEMHPFLEPQLNNNLIKLSDNKLWLNPSVGFITDGNDKRFKRASKVYNELDEDNFIIEAQAEIIRELENKILILENAIKS